MKKTTLFDKLNFQIWWKNTLGFSSDIGPNDNCAQTIVWGRLSRCCFTLGSASNMSANCLAHGVRLITSGHAFLVKSMAHHNHTSANPIYKMSANSLQYKTRPTVAIKTAMFLDNIVALVKACCWIKWLQLGETVATVNTEQYFLQQSP